MWIAALLSACRPAVPVAPPPEPGAPSPVAFAPAPATLVRVTADEWRNSAEDLFGVRFAGALPLDYRLLGYGRVGGSQLTVPPADLDLYEAAAWSVAGAAAPDAEAVERSLGVDPSALPAVRARLAALGTRAWRRPPTTTELDELLVRWADLEPRLGSAIAMQATVAALLLSPDFLFRVESGTPDAGHPGWRRLTGWERAARLASFVTASVPDDELVRAAAAGELDTDVDALVEQAGRLVETPRGRAAMASFFAETMELHELDSVTKDLDRYPAFTETLRAEMKAEVEALFVDVALDRGADLGELLTTDRSFAGPELARLYGVSPSAAALPPEQARGGVLGRAAFLTIQSHNTLTSPTSRGKFVRTRLLCGTVAPPPPGVATDLEGAVGDTLRERLEQHATDPVCQACHTLMDPIGFALEHFDPIGQRREDDGGFPIDATGSIDGAAFDGAAELGAVVAATEQFSRCVTTQLYRYANAGVERDEDDVVLDAIDADFVDAGRAFRPLVEAIVRSEGFLTVGAPEGEDCAVEGETRPCASACGEGVEVCATGTWRGCTAPAPAPEACDGRDDDCDGAIDEDLERSCADGDGLEACDAGAWGACEGPVPDAETCNGRDDDGDGATDEDLSPRLETFSDAAMRTEGHPDCDVAADPWSPACHAAAHRGCAARGCAVSGFGPVTQGRGEVELTCLDDPDAVVQWTSFSALSGAHPDCTAGNRQGGPCNAAIHRSCAALGLVTGYGPVENNGDVAVSVCVPSATVLNASYTALSAADPGCHQGARWGAACDRAIHAWCRGEGYGSGFGPLENSGDLAIVACVEVP